MEASGGQSDSFEVSSSPETAAEEPRYEGANVCRVAGLSTMLGGDRQSVRELAPELDALGFPSRLTSGDRVWVDIDLLELFSSLQDRSEGEDRGRVWRWQMIGETAQPEAAIRFLVAVLGSNLERESAAAAAALWRHIGGVDHRRWARRGPDWFRLWDRLYDLGEPDWPESAWWGFPWSFPGPFDVDIEATDQQSTPWDPSRWTEIYQRAMSRLGDRYGDIYVVGLLSRWRLGRALRSPDVVTRSLAMAAFPPRDLRESLDQPPPAGTVRVTPPGALVVSTMVHGTWGWKGDWWRPRAEFHEFILRNHRPNLYSRGAKFSWSGAYRDNHRAIAASDFLDWAYDVAPNGLQSVFAHSYGGDVAARAVLAGALVNELVLLSAPVTGHIEAAARSDVRIVDVRLGFDPVLALARTRQRIEARPNVTPVLLEQWRLDHGATHQEQVWREEDVARRGRL